MNKNHYEAVKFIPTYAMQTQQKNYNKKKVLQDMWNQNQQWQWSCLAHDINGVWIAYQKEVANGVSMHT
jgi:hypothetical protein